MEKDGQNEDSLRNEEEETKSVSVAAEIMNTGVTTPDSAAKTETNLLDDMEVPEPVVAFISINEGRERSASIVSDASYKPDPPSSNDMSILGTTGDQDKHQDLDSVRESTETQPGSNSMQSGGDGEADEGVGNDEQTEKLDFHSHRPIEEDEKVHPIIDFFDSTLDSKMALVSPPDVEEYREGKRNRRDSDPPDAAKEQYNSILVDREDPGSVPEDPHFGSASSVEVETTEAFEATDLTISNEATQETSNHDVRVFTQPPPAVNLPVGGHHPMLQQQSSFGYPVTAPFPNSMAMALGGGRRKIHLRVQEEVQKRGFLGSIRKRSSSSSKLGLQYAVVDKGNIHVSWYDGTTTVELQQHVLKSLTRMLNLAPHIQLVDLRILDDAVDPPEEIVLSPYIPDGSEFLIKFSTQESGMVTPKITPESPSGTMSPYPYPSRSVLDDLNETELNFLNSSLAEIPKHRRRQTIHSIAINGVNGSAAKQAVDGGEADTNAEEKAAQGDVGIDSQVDTPRESPDPIEAQLRMITDLLLADRKSGTTRRQEKRQVIFVLANYFVLFLSVIAISAELQARAPNWLQALEKQMKDVQDCAATQEALFECVSRGDFAGLVASTMLWLSRSVATRRVFLFGFETPKKLWTVVYESFVTGFCWGLTYLFVRRGMNPDTRRNFIQKFWKDALYGSLAGFNASFLKAILKNLIPQEAVEDVLRDRQLKLLSWFPKF